MPACLATDKDVSVACYPIGETATYVDIDVFGTGDCTSASIEMQTCPDHGTVSFPSTGIIRYTPCENYAGSDKFTYTFTGVPTPGVGTVKVSVTGNNCCYVEATRCANQTAGASVWLLKNWKSRNGRYFKHDGICYEVAAGACTTCPPSGATTVTIPDMAVDDCSSEECVPAPCSCPTYSSLPQNLRVTGTWKTYKYHDDSLVSTCALDITVEIYPETASPYCVWDPDSTPTGCIATHELSAHISLGSCEWVVDIADLTPNMSNGVTKVNGNTPIGTYPGTANNKVGPNSPDPQDPNYNLYEYSEISNIEVTEVV